jgi:DNA-3-methyladenine glycosylase I
VADPVLVRGEDGRRRCSWAASTPDYLAYHDAEWGRPLRDDVAIFERLCLEGFQSGLSWLTILRKREHFRAAFDAFEPHAIARYRARDVKRLLADAGIVRHRGKIEATIANARAFVGMSERDESLGELVWSHRPQGRRRAPRSWDDLPSRTPESIALSHALRARGFRFLGPTTVYATMQAIGVVNDHFAGCHARSASS